MTDLAQFAELVPLDHGLSVVVTLRADHSPHTTVVNAGILAHPLTGDSTVAFVDLHQLGWFAFEQLSRTICREVYGQPVEAYSHGPDGGVDGALLGP